MMGITRAVVAARPLESLLTHQVVCAVIAGLALSTPLWPWLKQRGARVVETLPQALGTAARTTGALAHVLLIIALLLISAAWLAGGTYNPFIYFRF
jgi:alginate O-acetyltransferase complex protein AlgI